MIYVYLPNGRDFFSMKPTPVEVSFKLHFLNFYMQVFKIPCTHLPPPLEISNPLRKWSIEMFWDYPVWPLTALMTFHLQGFDKKCMGILLGVTNYCQNFLGCRGISKL